ncbi:response regulator [Asanoa ishikariensis]|uniref:Two-component system, NarL family, nitrate/nitrite response regulator NarP n=1 Tax=Asanoa ishikariensis TaxID=137265 RepID=A0A1H3NF07_9ACTN|nr:response regulator [Asanoa ishikariensis]GIF68663.1 response regulator [Asanoa ishikariensis]SDY87466.1 two-component system, NarL family, nitrate/nitrite response regulator NarP [Asanoa ishikariensis]
MNLLIVDDSERFVRSARRLLEREGAVVATAATGAEAIAVAAALSVDVSLVDVQLGTESGPRVADALAARGLGGRILLISTRGADDLADLLAGSAAVGFVPKSDLSVAAIRAQAWR